MDNSVNSSFLFNRNPQSVRERTLKDGKIGLCIGAVVGATEGYLRKSWLNKEQASDKFIGQVKDDLVKSLSPENKIELKKINTFFAALTDSKINVYSLRQHIVNCEELSNAVEKQGSETTKDALDRIFANKDTVELRQELRHLQNRTKLDKTVDIYAARNLINNNFDSKSKNLKKADSTSQEVFNLIKKSANKIKLKTAGSHMVIGGILASIAGLLIGASKHKHLDKQ